MAVKKKKAFTGKKQFKVGGCNLRHNGVFIPIGGVVELTYEEKGKLAGRVKLTALPGKKE